MNEKLLSEYETKVKEYNEKTEWQFVKEAGLGTPGEVDGSRNYYEEIKGLRSDIRAAKTGNISDKDKRLKKWWSWAYKKHKKKKTKRRIKTKKKKKTKKRKLKRDKHPD
tara:strand:- start:213 stop:539 length:327 start_codon:yes stop_codon:yes gene_type:complete